ncbi:kinase-like domain-containing protein, partial [Trichophaea hybrida]
KLNKWVRGQELGRGTFGTVWIETREMDNSVRAVKVISKRVARQSHERWAQEIANLTALKEYPQHFVQFLESFQDDDFVSIAMEYIQHGDLGQHLTGPWTEVDATLITIQLLEGLDIMHNLGITHRDLRPENIFVVSLSPILVKIGDFGISKRVQNNITIARTYCGMNVYMAPEVYIVDDHEHSQYTNAVDIWSLGCVVHKILTGQTPFNTADYWRYVNGLMEFPVQYLEKERISEPGVGFIKCLMERGAGSRPSAEQARKGVWLNVVEEM